MLYINQRFGWTKIYGIDEWPKNFNSIINLECEAEYKGYVFHYKISDKANKRFGSYYSVDILYKDLVYSIPYKALKDGSYLSFLRKLYHNKYIDDNTFKNIRRKETSKRAKDYPVLKNYVTDEEWEILKNKYITEIDKLTPICPYCHNKASKSYPVYSLIFMKNFSCGYCSDGISYPNKFIRCFLEQLNIHYIPEMIFSWAPNKRYDFYIMPNIIIEANGAQHYIKGNHFFHELEYQQSNDSLKEIMALNNHIEFYIKLDCSVSEIDYIKKSIMNSLLPKILSFNENDIDWQLCEKYCLTSLMMKVIDYYNIHPELTSHQIAEYFNISFNSVINYLKRGANCNLCSYDPKVEMQKSARKNKKDLRYPFRCIENGYMFDCPTTAKGKSIELFGKQLYFTYLRKHIEGVSRYSHIGGYHFEYMTKKEFNIMLEKMPNKTFGRAFVMEE